MKSKSGLISCIAIQIIAGLAVLAAMGGGNSAGAKSSRDGKRDEFGQSRAAGAPLLAIVALGEQRVTIYDAAGKILQSPVSTGATGYETPAGIYSVVQKKEVHHSNVYEDGSMPFMQRITWTGIALHAGVLPGQPASHGCVRMPIAFAQHLFGMTDIGLRVIVVRDDIRPSDIDHPNLFKANPARRELALVIPPVDRSPGRAPPTRPGAPSSANDIPPSAGSATHVQARKSIAAAKSAEAEAAAKTAAEAKRAAARKAAEAAPAAKMLRAAEANLTRAEELLKGAERGLETASSPESMTQAELAKERALAKVAEAQAQVQAARIQAQAKIDAATRASEEARAAEAAKDVAAEAANEAARKTSPVSVFISRKTQRLYVRQGYQPVFEGPLTIRDADKPIGTYVFTMLNYANDGAEVRWSVVSMYKSNASAEPAGQAPRRGAEARNAEATLADVVGAKAALDRIEIPQDAMDRISEVVLPGSSLIVSDEGASVETGKDTDFVVLMSREPQGGIKSRRREPMARYRNDDFFGGPSFKGFPFFWN